MTFSTHRPGLNHQLGVLDCGHQDVHVGFLWVLRLPPTTNTIQTSISEGDDKTNLYNLNLIKRKFTIAYIVLGGLMLLIQDLALSEVAEQTTIQPRHDEHTDDAHAG